MRYDHLSPLTGYAPNPLAAVLSQKTEVVWFQQDRKRKRLPGSSVLAGGEEEGEDGAGDGDPLRPRNTRGLYNRIWRVLVGQEEGGEDGAGDGDRGGVVSKASEEVLQRQDLRAVLGLADAIPSRADATPSVADATPNLQCIEGGVRLSTWFGVRVSGLGVKFGGSGVVFRR